MRVGGMLLTGGGKQFLLIGREGPSLTPLKIKT